jgi:hypothetical protein
VISPLLANVYLHYVFDLWAQRWRRREATGDMIVSDGVDAPRRHQRAKVRCRRNRNGGGDHGRG